MALGIGSVIIFASLVMASQVGETAALRQHAAELLLLLGIAVVMLVERPVRRGSSEAAPMSQPSAIYLSSPSS